MWMKNTKYKINIINKFYKLISLIECEQYQGRQGAPL